MSKQVVVKLNANPEIIDILASRPAPPHLMQSQLHKYFNSQDTFPKDTLSQQFSASKEKMLDLTVIGYNLEAMGNARTYDLIQTMKKQEIHALLVQGTRQRYSNDIKMAIPKANPTDEIEYYEIYMEECGTDLPNIMAGVAIFLSQKIKTLHQKEINNPKTSNNGSACIKQRSFHIFCKRILPRRGQTPRRKSDFLEGNKQLRSTIIQKTYYNFVHRYKWSYRKRPPHSLHCYRWKCKVDKQRTCLCGLLPIPNATRNKRNDNMLKRRPNVDETRTPQKPNAD